MLKSCSYHNLLLITFLILLLNVFVINASEAFNIVEIENGKIRGEFRDYFYAFEGIPYAEPPTGRNRFQPPKNFSERWDGIRDFVKQGSNCMQWDHLMEPDNRLKGSEDCLFLNVFVPKSVMESHTKQVPVFFYIHGGAFMFGGSDFYSPLRFMQKDVILVIINYRLGPLGFLSTDDEVIPGNMGMKDQLLALKWVHRNIHNFNGNRNEITIMGFSAGGASVHMHYLSPLSRGLFKNGISFSGCALNPWVITENSREKFYKTAEFAGCPTTNDHREMLECLLTKPAEDIVRSVQLYQPFLYNPFSPFGIHVEKNNQNDPFLPDYPSILLERQEYQKLPWLATATQDEGLYPAGEFYNPDYLEIVDQQWNELAPHLFDYNGTFYDNSNQKLLISQRIREEYFTDGDLCYKVCKDSFFRFRDIFSDRLYNYGIRKALFLQSKWSPTYFYLFDHKITLGIGELMSGIYDVNLGIAHGEDVVLLLLIERVKNPLNEIEMEMSEKLLDMLLEFNKSGHLSFNGMKLPKLNHDKLTYMKISSSRNSTIDNLYDFGNGKFWDEILHDHTLEN